jgi:hypothetical protein
MNLEPGPQEQQELKKYMSMPMTPVYPFFLRDLDVEGEA